MYRYRIPKKYGSRIITVHDHKASGFVANSMVGDAPPRANFGAHRVCHDILYSVFPAQRRENRGIRQHIGEVRRNSGIGLSGRAGVGRRTRRERAEGAFVSGVN